MKMKPGDYCPLLKKKCVGLKCAWYAQVRGMNPNTGEMVDNWGCSMAWLPVLLIENAQQGRQAGAAIESFRNEVVKQQDAFLQLASDSVKLKRELIDEK